MTNRSSTILGWSAYLCCSWVWCIGLFYPILLYRDFGIAALLLFAIPNVIGAALVPWFIKNAQSSEKFTTQHSFACRCFSFITILFNMYFLSWVMIAINPSIKLISLIFLLLISLFIACQKRILVSSIVVLLSSVLVLLYVFLFRQNIGLADIGVVEFKIDRMLGLAPVFAIGFFFCPYLDLTFHRAIKDSNQSQNKSIFILGFYLLFFGLLIFGINYYPVVYEALLGSSKFPKNSIFYSACFYILLQTSFTSIVHLKELFNYKSTRLSWIVFICCFILVVLFAVFANNEIKLFGKAMHLREALYRSFLSVYGLLAPMYIWIFVVMKYSKSQYYTASKQRWYIWFIAVLLALPFYFVGFYGDLNWIVYVLPIGVLLALLTPFKSVTRVMSNVFTNEK